MVPRQYVMKMSSGSSRPYEQAPSGSGNRCQRPHHQRQHQPNGSNNKCCRDTTSNDLPAPMPFSPFSSSASSLKFRGTWAAMVMMLPVCFVSKVWCGGEGENRSAVGIDRRCKQPGRLQGRLSGAGTGNRDLRRGTGIPVQRCQLKLRDGGAEGGVESCRLKAARALHALVIHTWLVWQSPLTAATWLLFVGCLSSSHSKPRAACNRRTTQDRTTLSRIASTHPPTPISGQTLKPPTAMRR